MRVRQVTRRLRLSVEELAGRAGCVACRRCGSFQQRAKRRGSVELGHQRARRGGEMGRYLGPSKTVGAGQR
jgi:hypothetical protein